MRLFAPAVLTLGLLVPFASAVTLNHHRDVASETTGIASWYGKEHQGKKMSNGQPFDRFKLTAASRTLPLGSRIEVRNTKTDLTTVVTITDRGPWIHSRILDLSEAAAKAIECHGTCSVTLSQEGTKNHADRSPDPPRATGVPPAGVSLVPVERHRSRGAGGRRRHLRGAKRRA